MAEPTTEGLIHGLSNYDLTTYGGMSKLHDIAHGAASRLALLSRQNEELRKALVEIAEIKPTELTIGNSYFRPAFEVDWAVWNRAREIARTALSAPSPSETEKSG